MTDTPKRNSSRTSSEVEVGENSLDNVAPEPTATSSAPNERRVKDTFDDIWKKASKNVLQFSDMDREIASIVMANLPKPNCKILEVGSGTGKISAILACAGHKVTLLDISPKALEISQEVFRLNSVQCDAVIEASMFNMPVESASFDVAWNAGVIEHFTYSEQIRALAEMLRAVRPGGFVITLNPSARGWIYRWGKHKMEKKGIWEFGQEFPVRTLRQHCKELRAELRPEREVLPTQQFLFHGENGERLFRLCGKSELLRNMVRLLFGGYLKLSVIRKPMS